MKARRAVVVVSAAQHSRVHRCWHLLIQTLHCGWRVLHCGRRVLHCGRRRSIEIGMLVHKDLHCWSVLRIFTNQGKVSSNIFVNIKIFLRNLRKYLIIYPLDKNPWFDPLCNDVTCLYWDVMTLPCWPRWPPSPRPASWCRTPPWSPCRGSAPAATPPCCSSASPAARSSAQCSHVTWVGFHNFYMDFVINVWPSIKWCLQPSSSYHR